MSVPMSDKDKPVLESEEIQSQIAALQKKLASTQLNESDMKTKKLLATPVGDATVADLQLQIDSLQQRAADSKRREAIIAEHNRFLWPHPDPNIATKMKTSFFDILEILCGIDQLVDEAKNFEVRIDKGWVDSALDSARGAVGKGPYPLYRAALPGEKILSSMDIRDRCTMLGDKAITAFNSFSELSKALDNTQVLNDFGLVEKLNNQIVDQKKKRKLYDTNSRGCECVSGTCKECRCSKNGRNCSINCKCSAGSPAGCKCSNIVPTIVRSDEHVGCLCDHIGRDCTNLCPCNANELSCIPSCKCYNIKHNGHYQCQNEYGIRSSTATL